jgi:hypothetical protein
VWPWEEACGSTPEWDAGLAPVSELAPALELEQVSEAAEVVVASDRLSGKASEKAGEIQQLPCSIKIPKAPVSLHVRYER